jgi:hypothetical protein
LRTTADDFAYDPARINHDDLRAVLTIDLHFLLVVPSRLLRHRLRLVVRGVVCGLEIGPEALIVAVGVSLRRLVNDGSDRRGNHDALNFVLRACFQHVDVASDCRPYQILMVFGVATDRRSSMDHKLSAFDCSIQLTLILQLRRNKLNLAEELFAKVLFERCQLLVVFAVANCRSNPEFAGSFAHQEFLEHLAAHKPAHSSNDHNRLL